MFDESQLADIYKARLNGDVALAERMQLAISEELYAVFDKAETFSSFADFVEAVYEVD